MTTDWKALCVELAKELAEEYGVQREFANGDPLLGSGAIELLSRVRTALDQPEPEGPTLEEMNELFWKHSSEIGPSLGVGLADEDAPALIREALARWGRPAVEPVPDTKARAALEDLGVERPASELSVDELMKIVYQKLDQRQ